MNHELFALLDVFVASAEEDSFAAAAARLHMTRSGVAKAIARLEQRLGATLFHRSTRRCVLSDLGSLYLEHALRVRAEMEAAGAALDEAMREPRGRVRVTMPVVFGRRLAAPLLLALGRRHPQLELELSFTDRLVDLAHEGFDVAVRVGPIADSTEIVARPAGSSPSSPARARRWRSTSSGPPHAPSRSRRGSWSRRWSRACRR